MIASRLCFLSKIVRLTKDITGGFPVSFDARNIYHLALKCSFKTLGVNFIGVCFFSPHCRLSRNGEEGNGYTAGDRDSQSISKYRERRLTVEDTPRKGKNPFSKGTSPKTVEGAYKI